MRAPAVKIVAMQRCSNCGYKNDFNAQNCQLCSAKLGEPPRRVIGAEPDIGHGAGSGPSTKRILGGASERHYMVPTVGDHVKLEPGFSYLMGRDQSCRIRVGSPKVSRKHAEIIFQGEPSKPFVKDLGGQNGTRVNGEAIPKEGTRELKDWDEIEVGDVKIVYRKLAPGEAERVLRQDAGESTEAGIAYSPMGGLDDTAADESSEAAIRGDATFIPLSQVLRRLEELKATGLLTVEATGQAGFLTIQGGKALGGTFAGQSGPAAAAAVSRLTTGKFRFEAADTGEGAAPSPESTRPTQKMAPLPAPSGLGTPAAPPRPPAPRPGAPTPPPQQAPRPTGPGQPTPARPTRPLGPPLGPGGAPPPKPQQPPQPPRT